MKKKILFLLLIVALVAAVPAAAKTKEPVGVRINLLTGSPTSVPAGDPFHLKHGWSTPIPDEGPIGAYSFELDVDGVYVEPTYIERSASARPTVVTIWFVFNFPDGMSGTHTFTGHWFGPCYLYGAPGTCTNPNAPVEADTQSLEVSFP